MARDDDPGDGDPGENIDVFTDLPIERCLDMPVPQDPNTRAPARGPKSQTLWPAA